MTDMLRTLPDWAYVVIVILGLLACIAALGGRNGGSHTDGRSAGLTVSFIVLIIGGLVMATLWWRGVIPW